MKINVFIFGFGYTAKALVRLLNPNDYIVYGTSRNADTRKLANQNNITLCDYTYDQIKHYLDRSHIILICIPPHEHGMDPVFSEFKQDILSNINLKWLGYLSTTSVYGDHNGDWVDEESKPINPTERAQRRILAEQNWLSLFNNNNLPVHIFRLAGIYGPGRNNLDRLKSGKNYSVFKPGQFFSRIHVEDIARILLASIQHPTPGEVYNVCDDYPAPSHEVDEYAASLLHIEKPMLLPFEEADLSEMAKDFYQSNKKVSNRKVKDKLSLKLLYPSFREGLTSIKNQISDNN